MNKLRLTLAVCDYDRAKGLFLGRTAIEGCDIVPLAIDAEECFHRAFKFQEFDIAELSLSSHMATVSRGEKSTSCRLSWPASMAEMSSTSSTSSSRVCAEVWITSAHSRCSGIYIRTDRGINKPEDLRGRTVGVPEYQITANVWIRGMLQDDFGVKPEEIHWRRGGIEESGRGGRAPAKLPPRIDLQQGPPGETH